MELTINLKVIINDKIFIDIDANKLDYDIIRHPQYYTRGKHSASVTVPDKHPRLVLKADWEEK